MSGSGNADLARLQTAPREMERWHTAQIHLTSGRYSHALAGYRGLVNSHPEVAQLWFEFGIAAGGDLDFSLAHQAFQTSAALAKGDVSLLVLIGQQYQRLRQLDHARQCFERAVAADPHSVHARLSLAAWLERERRLKEAWDCVEQSLAQQPRDAHALYFRAFLLHRQGRNSEAEIALRDLIKSNPTENGVPESSRYLLGTVLDELGNYSEALRWLCQAKSLVRKNADVAALERAYDKTDRQRRELLAALSAKDIVRWRQEPSSQSQTPQLAFLGGHPRSGTTLVEQILGAHPDVLAFDEPEAFSQEVYHSVVPAQSARGLTLDGLNALSAASRANLRQRYFKSLLREAEGESSAQVLLDKNPSPTSSLHLWLRVFPNLKVIIPLRDPRDVVISCFFQNLALTPASANFLSLERTARHFADLTDVWLRLKEFGGFDWMETRYEDVVQNIEAEGKRATEFLGLTWHPEQVKFHENARRKFVFAPTYHDVTKPVHNRVIGRWQHYAEELAPVLEKLAPYCRAFGYS
jgi:tetratricopeptide (TPR) repeat protein